MPQRDFSIKQDLMELKHKLIRAELDCLANVCTPMTEAFKNALKNRNLYYEKQRQLNQIPMDMLIIASMALALACLPITSIGVSAGGMLARGYANARAVAGLRNSHSMLRAISNARFNWSWRSLAMYGGYSHLGTSFTGALTYGGAKTFGDNAAYGVYLMRAKAFAEKKRPLNTLELQNAKLLLDPDYIGSSFQQYVNDHYGHLDAMIDGLIQDPELTREDADDAIKKLEKDPLFRRTPKLDAKNNVQPKFELLFYMYDILTSDKLVHVTTRFVGEMPVRHRQVTTDIGVMPSASNYPKPGSGRGGGNSGDFIRYFDPGTKVGERINYLYQTVRGRSGEFFRNRSFANDVDHEVMLRAEECLAELVDATSFNNVLFNDY